MRANAFLVDPYDDGGGSDGRAPAHRLAASDGGEVGWGIAFRWKMIDMPLDQTESGDLVGLTNVSVSKHLRQRSKEGYRSPGYKDRSAQDARDSTHDWL